MTAKGWQQHGGRHGTTALTSCAPPPPPPRGPPRQTGVHAGGSRMVTREARSWCCWCWGWVTPCCTRVAGLASSLASGPGCASSSPTSTSRNTYGRSTTPTPGMWSR